MNQPSNAGTVAGSTLDGGVLTISLVDFINLCQAWAVDTLQITVDDDTILGDVIHDMLMCEAERIKP